MMTTNLFQRLLVALCGVAAAAAVAHAGPDPDIPKNVREFDVAGIHVITRPSGPANHVIVAKLFIRGGTSVLPKDVSPIVEDLALDVAALSGPQGVDRAAYQRELQRMVTTIGPDGGRDFSTMTLRCVDETWNRSWELFTGCLVHPAFDEVELRNAKERTLIALRNRLSNPESYANYLADSAFYFGHPYGHIAFEADVPGINANVLAAHFKHLFVKARLLLVVVGNIDSADLVKKITSTIGTLPAGSFTPPVIPIPPNAKKQVLIVRPPIGGGRVVTNYIEARYLAPNRTDSLYYPMMRLISFVSGSLFREVRIQRNLSYAPDADIQFEASSHGEIGISTTLPDSAWKVARSEVIDFFRDYVIDDKYIKGGLSSWVTSTSMREQTNESQANELGKAEIYTGSWENAFRTVEGISNITAEQMNLAAQRYLKNMTIVVVGDPAAVTSKVFLETKKKDDAGGDSAR
ncbi:MAG TPA: insulinase family protein [Candidatus Kapabacteria bacterium]|nr:insulinase family protein [Candidatus Kapabacteria bacterium]